MTLKCRPKALHVGGAPTCFHLCSNNLSDKIRIFLDVRKSASNITKKPQKNTFKCDFPESISLAQQFPHRYVGSRRLFGFDYVWRKSDVAAQKSFSF